MKKDNKEKIEKFKLSSFKLGNNFDNFMYDMLAERVNRLEYDGALNILMTVGIDEKDAVGVLFGDYDIANTENEVLVVDNLHTNELNLYDPIIKFISDYKSEYRKTLDITANIFYRRNNVKIDILNTEDKDLPILTKYFPLNIELITDPNTCGLMKIDTVDFFNTVYKSIDNGDLEDLLCALDVSWGKYTLSQDIEYYCESRKILDMWEKVKLCILFISKYKKSYEVNGRLEGISKIKDEIEKIYCGIINKDIDLYYGVRMSYDDYNTYYNNRYWNSPF